jgi:hypothetical protein
VTRERLSPRCLVSVPGGLQRPPAVDGPGLPSHMPGRKRPAPADAMSARRALLDGLARDADLFEVLSGLAPLHPRNGTFRRGVPFTWPRTRWSGAGPAGPGRCPCRDCASGSCPGAPSAAGRTRGSSTRSWPRQLSTAGPHRTCPGRSPAGRPATCGSTPCTRRSPASARPPAGQASQCARHARTWMSAPAIRCCNAEYERMDTRVCGACVTRQNTPI